MSIHKHLETEVDPQNPNPRGAHGNEEEKDPLDEIIRSFNERWFQGWEATPEDQRIKFIISEESRNGHGGCPPPELQPIKWWCCPYKSVESGF